MVTQQRLLAMSLITALLLFSGQVLTSDDVAEYERYHQVINKTKGMVGDSSVRALASQYGLKVLNVTWEDTGRYKGSAVGPNISDMTIQVQEMDPRTKRYNLHLMPVIRFPNFSDVTADIDPDNFYLLVGNESGMPLRKVSLTELLRDLRGHLTKPSSWKGIEKSLLARRDTHVLVSAQACFLPIPRQGKATFNPVLFNYQSYEGDPAVLTILATREGTSVTVIDNKRDGFEAGHTWGQRLFFNHNGKRASLTGQRISDFKRETREPPNHTSTAPEAGEESGLNMVLLIQVPLKQKQPMRFYKGIGGPFAAVVESAMPGASGNIEDAVIGHGKVEGPFTEIDNLEIERHPDYPIRVTVQFYKATSNGVVTKADMADISEQIKRVYREADYVGSLMVEGDTGRPTEHDGPKFEPPDWWWQFWKRYQKNLGITPEEAIKRLRELHGKEYTPGSEAELLQGIQSMTKETQ